MQAIRATIVKLKGEIKTLSGKDEENLYLPIQEEDTLRKDMEWNLKSQLPYKASQYNLDKSKGRRDALKIEIEALDAEDLHISEVLEQRDPLKCTKCGQYMPDEKANEIHHEVNVDLNTKKIALQDINQAILRYKKEVASLSKLQQQYTALENQLEKILETKTAARLAIKEVQGKEEQMRSLKESLQELKDEKPEFNIEALTAEIESLSLQQRPLTKICSRLARKLKMLDWMIATPLSNSGLKVFIFNQMIQKVNAKLKNYASYIGFTPRFEVDLLGARKDINMVVYDGKYPIPFQDLSGGQSQMINVATAFAIHDIVSDGSINILFLDEVFESLSAKNVEIVGTIIGQKSRDKAIYLITHLQDFIAQTTDTLNVTRIGGQTQVG
jgi:DNA repair exonuclease SbcCD ATPase subunit